MRYQFYREHKYVSAALNDLERQIARTDFRNIKEIESLANFYCDLSDMLKGHAQYENERLHTLLENKHSSIHKNIAEDHAHQDEQLSEIEKLIQLAAHAQTDHDKIAIGNRLYLMYRKFVADNLLHLHEEETKILPELQYLYTDEELRQVEAPTYRSMTPDEMASMVKVLFPHMNPSDRSSFLTDMHKLEPEKFAIAWESIAPALSATERAAVNLKLNIEPRSLISKLEVHLKKPEDFIPHVEVAACYLEIDNKLLVLERALKCRFEPRKWGVPAGKIESGESPSAAALRELSEETGISLESPSQIQQLGSLYIRKPEVDYVYHYFKVHLNHMPDVQLSDEHESYTWADSKDLEKMPLMEGALEVLKHYREALRKKRSSAVVSSYLLLKQEGKILLNLRKNTGYCDGMWAIVAGHVEEGESATDAMIREAAEEIGIKLSPSQLKVVHVMHRKSNRLNVDIFFECSSWDGIIENREFNKCERLDFFPLDALPSNTIEYNVAAMKAVQNGAIYSEQGWDQ